MDAVTTPQSTPSTPAERAFAYLDGQLAAKDRTAFEAEVERDSTLAAEVAAARALFQALDALPDLSPSLDFSVRAMARLRLPASPWARFWSWMSGSDLRVVRNPFAALVEGELTPRQAAWVAAFAASEPRAAASLAAWKRLHDRLDRLPALAPDEGFPARVMARAPVQARVPVRRSQARNSLTGALAGLAPALADWTRRLLPRRQERLAAASGAAFGPVAVMAAVAWVVFSNPLVTVSDVLAFASAKIGAAVSGLADAVVGGLATTASGSSLGAGLWGSGSGGFLEGATGSASALAAGATCFVAISLASAWVLYKNVKVARTEELHAPA